MGVSLLSKRKEVEQLLDSGQYVLFLGAGASIEAGIKAWGPALDDLAGFVEAGGTSYAEAMRAEIAAKRYLIAAEFFYLSPITPEHRARALTSVFGHPTSVTKRLRALSRQRYRAVVTTNFDRSFIESATKESVDLLQFGESQDDLASARLCTDRFFIRLHGRIEVPTSIVLSKSHYERLPALQTYSFFVQSLLSDTAIIFFGFSFEDPFFVALLSNLREATRSRMRYTSYALLSADPEKTLDRLLNELNIIPLIYSPANGHQEAWDILTRRISKEPPSSDHYSERRIRHTLAGVLTHLRIKDQADLRTAVLGAAATATVERTGGGEISDLVEQVRSDLALPPAASELVKSIVGKLVSMGRLNLVNGRIVPSAHIERAGMASGNVSRLIRGILSRAEVRYAYRRDRNFDYESCLSELLLRVLTADGMTLAYSLVRRQARETEQVEILVVNALSVLDTTCRRRIEPLRESIVGVLTRPEKDEEEALDELASIAFVMCLTLSDPLLPAFAEGIAQQSIFLDASIALPWICQGHPSEKFYHAIVTSFGKPCLGDVYVNEIVSHRQLAISEYESAHLEEKERLKWYARLYGLNNINTFIGGYGGQVSERKDLTFREYLDEVAPFSNESEAADFLTKKGLKVVPLGIIRSNVPFIRQLIIDKLEEYRRPRDTIRITHDATMAGYMLDRQESIRPYFVTADRVFVNSLADSQYVSIISKILFPHQAFAIAQAAGRTQGVVRGLARTVFGVSRDASKQLREFYTDRVLAEYEPALISSIPSIVDKIVGQIESMRGSLLMSTYDEGAVSERVRQFAALDQFEGHFHEKMSLAKKQKGV